MFTEEEKIKILIACEFSGIVREAFRRNGHDAMSCDLLDTEIPGNHYKGDARDIINDGWDMMIAHPPCTYFANAGLHYLKSQPDRVEKQKTAFDFWLTLWNAPIYYKAFENPIGWLNTNWKKPTQIIQPYYFGHNELKTTCLWLHRLNPLEPTKLLERPKPTGYVIRKTGRLKGQRYNYYWRQSKTAKQRSRTFQGIANAMAEQWG